MSESNFSFCAFTFEQKQSITDIFKCAFQTKDDLLFEKYEFFSNWFYRYDTNSYTTPFLDRENLIPHTDDELFLKKYFSKEYWVGVHFPIYLTKSSNKKNILIVAEDPLRNFGDKLLAISKDYALLSTPFATHLDNCRRSLKEYWGFHNYLLESGYNIYITDIHKLWLKKEGNNKKESLPTDLMENFKKTFQLEMEFTNPMLIITYGSKAKQALDEMHLDIDEKLIPFLHPSKTANGSWKKVLSKHSSNNNIKCSSENKINYMSEIVRDKLK